MNVEDDSRGVTEEKDEHDAEQHEAQVHLLLVSTCRSEALHLNGAGPHTSFEI